MDTKLLHPAIGPRPQSTKVLLRIIAAPIAQSKPKMPCIFRGHDSMSVIGCAVKKHLRGPEVSILASMRKTV